MSSSSTGTGSTTTTTTSSSSTSNAQWSHASESGSSSSSSGSSTSSSSSSRSSSPNNGVPQQQQRVLRKPATAINANTKSTTGVATKKNSSSSSGGGDGDAPPKALLSDMEAFKSSHVGKLVGNPSMTYTKADTDLVKIPVLPTINPKTLASQPWELVPSLKALHAFKVCSPKEYKVVDYLVTASELLLDELTLEYDAQMETFKKKKPGSTNGPMKFTWRNKGKLAINFALACDCAKLLSDRAQFGKTNGGIVPVDPDTIVIAYIHYIQRKSQIPDETLGVKTYLVKLQDWKKGGTRYTAANANEVNNVQFPTADERREKLESFIQGGKEVEIESKVVTEVFMTNVGGVLRPLRTAGGTIYTRAPKRTAATPNIVSSNGPGPSTGPRPPGASLATKSITGAPLQFNAFKQNIFSLFGGVVLHFPPIKLALMGAFVKIIERAPDRQDKQYCLRLVSNVPSLDSAAVYAEFDKCGGLLVLRQWIMKAFDEARRGCMEVTQEAAKEGTPVATAAQKRQQIRQNHVGLAHSIIEFMANLFRSFSERTRTTWLAPTFGAPNPESSITAPISSTTAAVEQEPTTSAGILGKPRRHLTTTAYIASMIKGFSRASALDNDLIQNGSAASSSGSTTVLFEYTQKYNTTVDEKLRGVAPQQQQQGAAGVGRGAATTVDQRMAARGLLGGGLGTQPVEAKRAAWQINPSSDVLRDFPSLVDGAGMEVRDFVVDGDGPATDESQLTPYQRSILEGERTNWKLLAAFHGVYAGVGINPHVGIPGEGIRGSSSIAGGGPGGLAALNQLSGAAAAAYAGRSSNVSFFPTADLPLLSEPLSQPLIAAVQSKIPNSKITPSSLQSAPDQLLTILDKIYNPLVSALASVQKPSQVKSNLKAEEGGGGGGDVKAEGGEPNHNGLPLTKEEALAMRAFLLGVVRRRATNDRVHLLTAEKSGLSLLKRNKGESVVVGSKRERDEESGDGDVIDEGDNRVGMLQRIDGSLMPVWPTAEELLAGAFN